MAAGAWVHPPIGISLGAILLILVVSVGASLLHARRSEPEARQ
jgi:hypothetical protein